MFYVVMVFEGKHELARSKPFESLEDAQKYRDSIHELYKPTIVKEV